MKFVFLSLIASLANLGQSIPAASSYANQNGVKAAGLRRTLPDSPDLYTPSYVDCPSDPPTVRLANSLSQNETSWLEKRRNNTVGPLKEFLNRANISGFDAGTYIDKHQYNASALPNIALAFSGGGWRALLNGAGALKAWDARSFDATLPGRIGGLLQASTYIAGLSGGSWLVGTVTCNNFTTVEALAASSAVWQFQNSVLEGPPSGGIQLLDSAGYYLNLLDTVNGKSDAGFQTSITDYWGRALSYQLINATDGGPAQTFASTAEIDVFQHAEYPFPIVVADARAPGQVIVGDNSSVFEFNPYEMGTWDPTTFGFVPTRYLGTNMTNGKVSDSSKCVVGFDNVGYVLGTSSSLFNSLIIQLRDPSLNIPAVLKTAITAVLAKIGGDNNDIADYDPNPFYGWNPTGHNYNVDSQSLTLVDGGEDGQNIPFTPLMQPLRHVDVIIANDNGADTSNYWPNGSSLVNTYERSLSAIGNETAFPSIPDVNTFVNLGLNTRPTFFGCNSSNITVHPGSGQTGADVPLIVYLPNCPYVTESNQPTLSLTTNMTYRDALIANGYAMATMANGTRSGYENWQQCLACATLSRSFTRTGTTVPEACKQCFEQYCWNGTIASQTPPPYDPQPLVR